MQAPRVSCIFTIAYYYYSKHSNFIITDIINLSPSCQLVKIFVAIVSSLAVNLI